MSARSPISALSSSIEDDKTWTQKGAGNAACITRVTGEILRGPRELIPPESLAPEDWNWKERRPLGLGTRTVLYVSSSYFLPFPPSAFPTPPGVQLIRFGLCQWRRCIAEGLSICTRNRQVCRMPGRAPREPRDAQFSERSAQAGRGEGILVTNTLGSRFRYGEPNASDCTSATAFASTQISTSSIPLYNPDLY